jgi:hypothetical protein
MEGQWVWQQVCSMAVGIVVVVVVVAALGCVVVFRITKISINMYVKRKIYCVKLPTVCYQANTETGT